MVLTNAVYFQADWQYRFDASQTQEAPFYLEDGTEKTVPMMFSEGVHLRHYYEEDYQLLEIPYVNGQYTMVVILPNVEKTIDEAVNNLTAENLATRLAQADTLTTQLYLPKFKMEFKTDLVKTLTDMGMGIAFGSQASLGGFFTEIKNGLALDQVVHQAFLEINETGSEAEAATAVTVVALSSNAQPMPQVIRVDRPFVLMIRERHTGAVLFAGKVMQL